MPKNAKIVAEYLLYLADNITEFNNPEEQYHVLMDIEDLTEKELDKLHKYYEKLSELAEQDNNIHLSHSIDAAEDNHEHKLRNEKIHKEIDNEM